jgi:hypothetical protein
MYVLYILHSTRKHPALIYQKVTEEPYAND